MKNASDMLKNKIPEKLELERNFDEACSDLVFSKIVGTIKLPKETMIKYTSLIKDSSLELKNCKNCKNIMECKNAVTGFVYYPEVEQDSLVFSYIPCKYKRKLDKENNYQKNIVSFDMPRDIVNASMKDIFTDDESRLEAIKWLTTFIKQYDGKSRCKGLYLTGNFGCGKTYLISATLNELAKKGHKVAIIYYPEFLRSLKETFSEDISFSDRFNQIKKAELLLLDDIGAETTTSWNRDEILGTILQYRMQEALPTFFTSNLTIEELETHLASNDREGKIKSRRVIERIKYLTDNIVMIAENRRK